MGIELKAFFNWKLLILPALAVVITLIVWPALPEIIPTHFDVQGLADGGVITRNLKSPTALSWA